MVWTVAAIQGGPPLEIRDVETSLHNDWDKTPESQNIATFTLSLDCEGLWGMADGLQNVPAGAITNERLADAYARIIRVLEQARVKATAAFVTCFAVESDVLYEYLSHLREMQRQLPIWFTSVVQALERNELDGWQGASLYRAMKEAGCEMAWHGTTHVPLSSATAPDVVALELDLAKHLLASIDHDSPKSIVFPRNQVGHFSSLETFGFQNYRNGTPAQSRLARFVRLAPEFLPFGTVPPTQAGKHGGLVALPEGVFLNWPAGLRSAIPDFVTIERWRAMIRDAIRTGRNLHMWFHPHNLLTAPRMQHVFETVMAHVGEEVKAGRLEILTMAQLAERR